MTQFQSRRSHVGIEYKTDRCIVGGGDCTRADGDCGRCPVVADVEKRWICAFCLSPSDPPPLPGVYSSGPCYRCLRQRILRMAFPSAEAQVLRERADARLGVRIVPDPAAA